jgi:Cys-tRNA(Pro) deacylase
MTTTVPDAPPQLLAFLAEHRIEAEFLAPGVPMPTVIAAAVAIGVSEDRILKTLLFRDELGRYVVAIANGTGRVSPTRLAEASGLGLPRAASPASVLAVTGYPAGGVAPIGLPGDLPVILDQGVAKLPMVFAGGGRENLLLRLDPADIIRLNRAIVARIVDGD